MEYPEFPDLPSGVHRSLVFCGGRVGMKAILTRRGYTCIELNTLPRNTEQDNVTYLLAKAQGLDEGTIIEEEDYFDLLKLQMKAYGLLDKRSTSLNLHLTGDADSIQSLFGWRDSRHTLAGNSTVVSAQKLLDPVPQES